MKKATHILIVEDSAADIELARRVIRKALQNCTFHIVETRKDFIEALTTFQPDVIVSDYALPRFDGITALKLARKHAPFTPLIIWTGSNSEDVAVECMKAGANNYVLKENLKRLGPAVIHALEERELLLAHEQAEQKYKTIFENAMEGIFQSSPEGHFLNLNPAMARIYGYDSPAEMMESVSDIATQIHAEGNSRSEFMKLLHAHNQIQNFEARNYRKDGSMIWTSTSARTVCDLQGKVLYYEGFVQDITQRKEAEEALQNNEKRYRALFENLPISIWEEDFSEVKEYLDSLKQQGIKDFREYFASHPQAVIECSDYIAVLGVNNATLKMYHANNRDELLRNINRGLSQSQLNYLQEAFISIAEGKTSFVWEGNDKTFAGEEIKINIAASVIPGYEDSLSKVIVAITDITERKRAEEAIQNSEKRFRALIENGLDDISLLAADGTLLWESPSTVRNLGYAPGEFLKRNIFQLMHPDDLEWTGNLYGKLIQEPGNRARGMFRLRRSDGTWRWMEAVVTNMLDEPSVRAMVVNYRDITERKQAEEILREERNLLRTLIDNIPDRIYAMDIDGRKTLSNTADWQASGGKTMHDVIGKTDYDTYPLDLAEEFWRLDKAVLESGQAVVNYEEPGLDAEGNRVSILTTKIPLRSSEGKVIGLVGIGRDITGRKQVEARLNDLLALNEKILNHSSVGILTYKVNGPCVFANEKVASIVGTTMAQLMSQNFRTIESWKHSGLYDLVEKAIATLSPTTADIHHISTFGKDVWMTVHCVTFKSNGEEHVLLSISDITERKQAEEKLRQSENRYRLALKATNDVIWEANLQTNQLFWSENAQIVFGYTPEEIDPPGTWWDDHLHPEDRERVLSKLNDLIAGDASLWMEEYRFRLKNGSYAYISDRGYIERDASGMPLRMIGAMTDITERQRAEEALRESENRLVLALSGAQMSVWEWNLQTNQILWSPEFFKITGVNEDQFTGSFESFTDLIHSDDVSRVRSAAEKAIHDQTLFAEEFRIICPNGDVRWLSNLGRAEYDSPGNHLRLIGTVQDVTLRKQAEIERQALLEIMQGLANTADLQELLRLIHHSIARVVYARNFFVVLYQPDTGLFEEIYSVDQYDPPAPPARLENSITSYVFRSGEPLLLTQVLFDELVKQGEMKLVGTNSASWLGVPLKTSGRSIGVMAVQDYDNDNLYTERDKHFLASIAAQVALAIERKQTEETIRESEERYRLLVENSGEAILVTRTDGTIYSANPEACRIFGRTEEEIRNLGRAGIADIHDPRLPLALEERKRTGRFQGELNLLRKDGSIFPADVSTALFNDSHGNERTSMIIRDISERKRAEEALRESEARFSSAFKYASIGMALVSPDGRWLRVNRALCQLVGYSEEELVKKTFQDITYHADLEKDVSYVHQVLAGEIDSYEMEKRYIHKSGKIIWVLLSASLVRDNEGKPLYFISQIQDITERKEVEDALQKSEALYRQAIEVAGAVPYYETYYDEGRLIKYEFIGEGIRQITGYGPEEFHAALWDSLVEEINLVGDLASYSLEEAIQRVRAGENSIWKCEHRLRDRDGNIHWVFEAAIELRDEDGVSYGSIGTYQDITERKLAEGALREAETKYRTLVEQLPAVTYLDVIDESIINAGEFNTSYISPQVEGLLGYPPHVFQTDRSLWSRLIHPEDRDRVLSKITEYYKNPGFYTDEYRMLTRKGDEIWVRDEAIMVRAARDKPPLSQGVIFDITEHKKAETALVESNAKFRTLFEASPDAILLLDRSDDWPVVDCNTAACQMNGYTRDELIGQPIDILNLQPTDPQGRAAYLEQIRKAGVFRVEATHRRKDGTIFPVDISTSLITLGGRELVLGIDRDITERRRMEAAEREQRALAEALRDTAEILSSTLDYGEVLDHILMAVGRVVPHDAATIMLIEGESARVVRSQGYNQRGFSAELIGVSLSIAETSNLQQMLKTGQPEVVIDTRTYAGWNQLAYTDWLRSNVGAPISIYGRIIGFILLDSGIPGFFTSVHAERLEAFANQAALAIHNARLLQQAQEEITERKRAEEALRLEKERLESIAATVPGIICSFRLRPDGSACMPFASPAIQDVYGFLPADLQEDITPLFARIHPEELPHVHATIQESARTMLPWHQEFRYNHPAKGEVWIEGRSVPLREADGSIIWHGFVYDVTERRRAEEDLRASEERFRQLADNIQEVFWMTDAESGQEIYMSPAAEKIWGQPLETLLYAPNAFVNSVFPEDQALVLQSIEKEKNGHNVEMEYRIVRPDGSIRWVWDRAFPIFDAAGKVKKIAGITADVTERRESEMALVKSQSRYRELFDSSPVSLWEEDFSLVKKRVDHLLEHGVTDLKGYFSSHPEELMELASLVMITDANQASLDLYHVERKEDLLKSITQALGEETLGHFQEEILGFLGPDRQFIWEGTEHRPDGKQMELVITGSLPHGYEDDWSKVIVSIVDITERKQAEQLIRRRAEENSILLKTSLALTNLDLKATLQTVGDSAKNLFAADGCRIFLMEPDGKSLRCVLALQESLDAFSDLRIRVGEGVTGMVAASGRPEIVNDMKNDPRAVQVAGTPEEEEAIMFAPLKERDNTVGVLSIRRIGGDRPFGATDLALLEALASMAASAVSNARLFAETQRRLSELEALYENGLAVGSLLKPSEIGKRLIHTFSRYLPWHHVTIRLRRDASDDLELVAFSLPNLQEEERANAEQHFIARINKVGQGLSGWVIQTGNPLRTGNVHAHFQYIDTHTGIQSGLYMPLKAGERVIGVISVESELPDAFTEQDERLLATLASQAAIAFENARLYQKIEQELSERKRAQEALLFSEAHYRELADSITDVLFELDHNLSYTHWNKASEMLTGVSARDAIGRPMHEIFGESEEQTRIRTIYEDVLADHGPRTFETTLILNGEKRSFDVNAYPSTRGVSVVAKDVTDRKRSQTILQKRIELMEYSAHHSLGELMQRTVDEVSELTGSMIGFFHFVQEDQKTLGDQTWSTNTLKLCSVAPDEGGHLSLEQAGVWAEAVRQMRPLIQNDYEVLTEKKGYPQRHVAITREIVIPIIRNEKVMAIMGIGNKPQEYTSYDFEVAERLADYAWDITERKQMQLALETERNQLAKRVEERTSDLSQANSNLARALRVKDEFLANMSHELRTPLNAILGLSESLGEQIAGPLNEKQQKYITTISESGHHLLSLINDILDLAKIEAGQITLDINRVDIHQVCQASLRMIKQLAQKKNQDIVLEIGEGIGLMWADERRLKQMIVNLLGNAVKFTPEHGKIGLEVRGDQLANQVTITVWDNGIGIREDDLARLFRPFVQLDSGLAREATGTGLGLALVAQMARLHGGSVSAVSEPGQGSRFSIILPWEPALAVDTTDRLRTTGKFRALKFDETNKPTILLVEDTKEVVMMIRDYLELAGYKVVTAWDGVEAIAQARLARPDLILMDVMMPRMDGFEATRKLRSEPEFKYTPIVALTALAMPSDRERCLAAGMDEYISKPINLKALVRIIQRCLVNSQEPKPG